MFKVWNNSINQVSNDIKPTNINTISDIASIFLNIVIGTVFSVSIITLAYAMVQYTMSKGDPKLLDKSWKSFLWSVEAALISIAAVGIKYAVVNAVGVTSPEIINNAPGI